MDDRVGRLEPGKLELRGVAAVHRADLRNFGDEDRAGDDERDESDVHVVAPPAAARAERVLNDVEDVDEDDFQVLEDTCAELRDRSGFSSLKTGARDKYVKGLTGRRSTPASRKLQLYRCCNSPSSIELVKIQVNAFGFDVQHARLIGVGAAFAGRGHYDKAKVEGDEIVFA